MGVGSYGAGGGYAMNELSRKNFVEPLRGEVLPPVRRFEASELNTVQHSLDVAPTATSHIEMKTSAKDRAQGFLIANVPMFAGLALALLLVCVFFFRTPLFSLTALVIFWLAFVAAWLVAYLYTLAISPEGIAMFEARQKWKIIEREQTERWDYYNKQDRE